MSDKQGRNIAIVGASGSVGSQTVEALLAYGIHTVTAISRSESTATFPAGVKVQRGPYENEEFLVTALRGQDVLILQVGIMALDSQIPLISAAAKASVPWVIPCEFASDNKHEKLNQEINLMTRKNKYREQIEQLGVSYWIGIINNPWFDWSFKKAYWGIDINTRKATFFDGGVVKCNTTTLRKVGKSLAALLSLPDSKLSQFKNEFVYFSSFQVSQREIFDSVMRATGTQESDWVIESESAVEAAEAAKDSIRKGDGIKNVNLLFATLFREGYGGDYEAKGTVNNMLGLEHEDFDEVIRELVREVEAGK
jgi:NmrA-like family